MAVVFSILMGSALLMTNIALSLEPEAWLPINDGVMGGISQSSMSATDDGLVFLGELSLENNGGFASVRRLVTEDLTDVDRVRLQIRGDGRTYQFRIRQDRNFDGVAWRAMLPSGDDWQTVDLPLAAFVPVFRGRTVRSAGPVVPAQITQVGFMLADKNPGRFKLEIRAIEFLAPRETPE